MRRKECGGCGDGECRMICTQRSGMYDRWWRYRYIQSFLRREILFFCAVFAHRSLTEFMQRQSQRMCSSPKKRVARDQMGVKERERRGLSRWLSMAESSDTRVPKSASAVHPWWGHPKRGQVRWKALADDGSRSGTSTAASFTVHRRRRTGGSVPV